LLKIYNKDICIIDLILGDMFTNTNVYYFFINQEYNSQHICIGPQNITMRDASKDKKRKIC